MISAICRASTSLLDRRETVRRLWSAGVEAWWWEFAFDALHGDGALLLHQGRWGQHYAWFCGKQVQLASPTCQPLQIPGVVLCGRKEADVFLIRNLFVTFFAFAATYG